MNTESTPAPVRLPLQSANERKYGRLMRDEAGHMGAPAGFSPIPPNPNAPAAAPADPNNPAGNAPTTTPAEPNNNNNGQGFDLNSFWNEPAPASTAPNGTQPNGTGGAGDDNAAFGTRLRQTLESANFGTVMTPEIAGQIAEGNFEGFNNAQTAQNRQVMQQALQASMTVMQRLGDSIMAEVDRRMGAQFTGRENDSFLSEAIPMAKDPKSAPIVKSVFNQSMKLCNNDKAKALEMTKDMLRGVATGFLDNSDSIGLPAPSAGDRAAPTTTNWMKELIGR